METFHFDLILKMITEGFSECITQQTFTVNGSRRLTEGLQYMNTFFQKFAHILIQLVLILLRMITTPTIPLINISNSLARHKKKENGSHSFHMHGKKCSSSMQSSTAYFLTEL